MTPPARTFLEIVLERKEVILVLWFLHKGFTRQQAAQVVGIGRATVGPPSGGTWPHFEREAPTVRDAVSREHGRRRRPGDACDGQRTRRPRIVRWIADQLWPSLPTSKQFLQCAQVDRLDEIMVEPRELGSRMISFSAISGHGNEHQLVSDETPSKLLRDLIAIQTR